MARTARDPEEPGICRASDRRSQDLKEVGLAILGIFNELKCRLLRPERFTWFPCALLQPRRHSAIAVSTKS